MNLVNHFLGKNASWTRLKQEPSSLRGANISSAGAHNRKIILHTIRSRQDVSRPEIAKVTGLTGPAVFGIARDLVNEGLITARRTSAKVKGQPVHNFRLNPDAAFGLGLEIDRDHLTFVAIDYAGDVRFRHHSPQAFASPAVVRDFVADCLGLIRSRNLVPIGKVMGLGVAIPDDLGRVTMPGQPESHRAWNTVNLPELIGGMLNVPVLQENDAASAAIGEMSFGHGLELESFFYVYIGAGLGGGLVVNRRYVRGAHGRSGEIGFLPQLNPLRSSQTNLQKTLGDAVLVSVLLDAFRSLGHENVSIDTLDQLPDSEGIIERWVGRVADYLYLPLLTVMATIDPDAILVGGRLPPAINEALCLQISKRLSMHVGMAWPQMAVRPAQVCKDAASVGAAFLAFRDIWDGNFRQDSPQKQRQTPSVEMSQLLSR